MLVMGLMQREALALVRWPKSAPAVVSLEASFFTSSKVFFPCASSRSKSCSSLAALRAMEAQTDKPKKMSNIHHHMRNVIAARMSHETLLHESHPWRH